MLDPQRSLLSLSDMMRKVRSELKNCVQTERLHGALGAVYGRIESLEYAFNLLPAGLASITILSITWLLSVGNRQLHLNVNR